MKRNSSEPDEPGRHRTPEEKARIIRDFEQSGLSLLAFARQQGLCYASLLRWRARRSTRPMPGDSEVDPRFVRVKLEDDRLGGEYVLSWPGGRCLHIPSQFEPESLRRLLSVLERRP